MKHLKHFWLIFGFFSCIGLVSCDIINGTDDDDDDECVDCDNDDDYTIVNFQLIENFDENISAIAFEDGTVMLYGRDEFYNNFLHLSRVDFDNGNIKESQSLYIQLDSYLRPASITTKDETFLISDYSNSAFDLVHIQKDGVYSEYNEVEMHYSNSVRTSLSTRDFTYLEFYNVAGVINTVNTIAASINKLGAGHLAKTSEVFDFQSLEISLCTEGSLNIDDIDDIVFISKGNMIDLEGSLYTFGQEYRAHHIGDECTIEILSMNYSPDFRCDITYSISGINEPPTRDLRLRVLWKDLSTGSYEIYELGFAQNGINYYALDLPGDGEYEIYFLIYDKCHPQSLTFYTKKRPLIFNFEYAELINDYYYDGENVNFDLAIYLSGEESLYLISRNMVITLNTMKPLNIMK